MTSGAVSGMFPSPVLVPLPGAERESIAAKNVWVGSPAVMVTVMLPPESTVVGEKLYVQGVGGLTLIITESLVLPPGPVQVRV